MRVVLLISLGVLASCAAPTPPTTEEIAQAKAAAKPSSQAAAPLAAMRYFGPTLKDPEAARYTFEPITNAVGVFDAGFGSTFHSPGWFMCGTINGKNSYGGYVGAERFIVRFDPKVGDVVANGVMDSSGLSIASGRCISLHRVSPDPAGLRSGPIGAMTTQQPAPAAPAPPQARAAMTPDEARAEIRRVYELGQRGHIGEAEYNRRMKEATRALQQ